MEAKPQMFKLKTYRGGIADYENKGTVGTFKFGSALNIRKRRDSLSCNQALEEIGTGVFVDLPLFVVPCSDGNAYAFGDAGNIYKITTSFVVTIVHTDTDGKIIGAGECYDNAGNTYIAWATSETLKKKLIPGLGNWSDVTEVATDLDPVDWHTMCWVGNLFICNGSKIAQIGYDASYTNEILQLIPGVSAKSIVEGDSDSFIVGTTMLSNSNKGLLFQWDQQGSKYIKKKPIPTKGINAIIQTEYLLMQGGIQGSVYFTDFVNVLPLIQFPGGGQVNPDAVENDEGLALFGVFGADDIDGNVANGVYGYGRKKKNGSFALNLEYPIDCDEIGSVKKVGDELFITYSKTEDEVTSYHMVRVDPNNKAQAIFQSVDLEAPDGPEDDKTNWTGVKLFTAPMPADTSIEIWIRTNKNGDFQQAFLDDGTDEGAGQFVTEDEQEAIFKAGPVEGEVVEVKAILNPHGNDSPEIFKIKPYFE